MNVLERKEPFFEQRNSMENPRVSISDPKALQIIFGEQISTSGVYVTEFTAMQLAAVATAVKILSETVASLPLQVYTRRDGFNEPASDHPYQYLLHDSPNDWTTSFIWRELGMAHVALWGNHYARLEWSRGGQLLGIYQLMPWQVAPYRKAGAIRYRITLDDGQEDLPAEEVLHIAGLSYDGLKGLSVIRDHARNTVGLAQEAENFGARFLANDARPGVALEHPSNLTDAAAQRLRESFSANYGGKNRSKPMVLEEGMKLKEIGIPSEDVEFIQTRNYQRSEIFGLYRIPAHLSGDSEKQTSWGTGIEQMDIGFIKHCIRPWLVRWEQELNRKIFGRRNKYFCEFNIEGFLRGDFKTRMDGYDKATGGPIMTVNEARRKENLPPLPGGDMRLMPVNNMAPVGADGLPKMPAQPAPANKDQGNEQDQAAE